MDAGAIRADVVAPSALGLRGTPDADQFADRVVDLAKARDARVILADGPQGWQAEDSGSAHARVCERDTRTPGKTGPPGVVKPASWTRMATFSIAFFDALAARGWPRLTRAWTGAPVAVESFPTHAWRCLGLAPLPGKGQRVALDPWREHLARLEVGGPVTDASHDELQALVAGLGGLQLLHGGWSACDVRGIEPRQEAGTWREGYILSPKRPNQESVARRSLVPTDARMRAHAPVSIRESEPGDTPALTVLASELQDAERVLDPSLPPGERVGAAYVAETVRACRESDGVILVALRESEVIGYCALLRRVPREGADEPEGSFALIRDLVVARRARGGGVGRTLLAAAVAEARAAGASEVRVELLSANASAAALYSETGFTPYLVTQRLRLGDAAP